MKGFIEEFKEFITRGNVLDMAVGIVIGSAFTAIVTSLVENIIMPIVGVIIGGIDFNSLSANISGVELNYGMFIQNIVNFLIIAFVVFCMIKVINGMKDRIKKDEAVEEEAPAEDPADIALLKEIRDLLAEKK